jgi:hypothetical protein
MSSFYSFHVPLAQGLFGKGGLYAQRQNHDMLLPQQSMFLQLTLIFSV